MTQTHSDKIQSLKLLMSDSLVMFNKLHNLHWNVKGLQFFEIHQKTEGYYQLFSTLFDDLAERLLQIGEVPVVTLKNALETSQIKEESRVSFNATEVLTIIKADFQIFLQSFRKLEEQSEGDSTTQSFAQDQVKFLEKELWMINQSLQH
jgi:starvation-inducible DNA-binding protein